MTRYRFFTATTLDGFLSDEQDSLDWLLSRPTGEESILPYDDFIAEIGAIVTGRTTYDWVRAHEGTVDGAWVFTQPTFLFTHRDTEPRASPPSPARRPRTAPHSSRRPTGRTCGSSAAATSLRTSRAPGCSTRSSSRSPR